MFRHQEPQPTDFYDSRCWHEVRRAAGGGYAIARSHRQPAAHLPKPQARELVKGGPHSSLRAEELSEELVMRSSLCPARVPLHGDLQRRMWRLYRGPSSLYVGPLEGTQRAVTPLAAATSWRGRGSGLYDLAAAFSLCSPLPSHPTAIGLCLSPAPENQAWDSNLRWG